ncbi:MAG: hypothetical protein A2687_01085 [Candidatus Levybacteria bacterium RIFCSPHIGHO2_01_FULL_38_26]|nr:MAG: hypothetical protein A2687_01085 [Candidatus Levybacteria bacterium RIFCSPHIGHO2_01_FULL_38_26]
MKKRSLLLCPPAYFSVKYKINPWMNPAVPVKSSLAQKQWQSLVDACNNLSSSVNFINPAPNQPDMVFAANGFFSIGKKAVLARFRYKERQGETKFYKKWLDYHGYEVIDPNPIKYEGEGDTLLTGDMILQGYGFRSDKESAKIIAAAFPDKKVIPLRLVDERFYHLDICCLPINKNLIYFYEKTFDKESADAIKSHFKKAVAISDEEALSFALNSLIFEQTVITNKNANQFTERVSKDGLKTITLDMSEFIKAGGSVKCLANEIWS